MKRSTLAAMFGCIAAVLSLAAIAIFVPGCSTFVKPNGDTARAPDPGKIEAAGTAVAAAARVLPPPFGDLATLAIAALATAVAAHYRGKEAGWTEAKGSTPTLPAP